MTYERSYNHSLTESDRYKVESSRVWSYSKPDYPVLVIGLVAATVNGIVWPAIAVAFAEKETWGGRDCERIVIGIVTSSKIVLIV